MRSYSSEMFLRMLSYVSFGTSGCAMFKRDIPKPSFEMSRCQNCEEVSHEMLVLRLPGVCGFPLASQCQLSTGKIVET